MRLIHIWCDYTGRDGAATARHLRAKQSWLQAQKKGAWVNGVVYQDRLMRNSRNLLHEVKPLPYVKDIIDRGIAAAKGQSGDMVIFTNDDSLISEDLIEALEIAPDIGCATRRDFQKLPDVFNYDTIREGEWHPGADLFFFTVAQWHLIKPRFPDMVYACQAWDLVLRNIFKEQGGVEIPNLIAHQIHPQWWVQNQKSPANRYNHRLAKRFFDARNLPFA